MFTMISKLRAVAKILSARIEELKIRGKVKVVQRTGMLGSVRILRKVLNIFANFLSLIL